MKVRTSISAVILALLLFSCMSEKEKRIREQLRSFMSETVSVPDNLQGIAPSGTLLYKDTSSLPKLIFYYDSSACNECEIAHLGNLEWFYVRSAEERTFDVLTIFSPSPEDYAGVVELLEIQDFDYPVYVDFDGRFRRTNAFIPEDVRFHSFLTDGSGRIRHVGNPSVGESLEKSFDRALDGIVRESSARTITVINLKNQRT